MVEPVDRGQSSVDFVIGIGVFFLAFSFVVVLLPDLLSPFANQAGPAVTDQAIGALAGGQLAADRVGRLDETCVEEFLIDESGTSCSFDAGDPSTTIAGIPDKYSLNVTLERNDTAAPGTEVVCYNGTAVLACSTGGDPLVRGRSPPTDSRSVWTARRVVSVDGETLWLNVRVW